MFTGIIRETGVVAAIDASEAGATVRVSAPRSRAELTPGASIAVDGVCLTVTELGDADFSADVVPETIRRTRLAETGVGDRVNLELPVRAGQFLDGHLVQGHVDGTGTVAEVRPEGTQTTVVVELEPRLAPYVAEKGSIAVNGVSLTVVDAGEDSFSVALIPTTLAETNLGELAVGDRVNLEVDVVARYVARWTTNHREPQETEG